MKCWWLTALLGILTSASAMAQSHPSVLINPNRVAWLRNLVYDDGNPGQWNEQKRAAVLAYRSIIRAAQYYQTLKSPRDSSTWKVQGEQPQGIMCLAMAHLLTGESAKGRFATAARTILANWRDTNFPMPLTEGNGHWNDLGSGDLAAAFAIAFDWLYQDMDPSEITSTATPWSTSSSRWGDGTTTRTATTWACATAGAGWPPCPWPAT